MIAIHLNTALDHVESLDVKYTIEGSTDRMVAVEWVDPPATVQRGGRSRKRFKAWAAHEDVKENIIPVVVKRRRIKAISAKIKSSDMVISKREAPQKTLPADDQEGFHATPPTGLVASRLSSVSPRIKRSSKVSSTFNFAITRDQPSTTRHAEHDDVYAYEVQQSRQIIDEAVRNEEPSFSLNHKEPWMHVAAPTVAICKKRSVFENLFYEILVDEGDGQINEDAVAGQVNNLARKRNLSERHDEAQVSEYLEHLCTNDKIMRSDGQLYSI